MATNSYDKIIKDATNVANSDYFGYSAGEGLGNSILGHYLMPGLEQDKEFGQEIALQQYQNEWNSETAKMQRSKDAGINPHVAAGQIAGSSSPSAGSPNTAVGAGASAVDAAAKVVDTITSIPNKLAEAENTKANATEVKTLLPLKAESLNNGNLLSLENIGLTRAQAQAVSISNYYKPREMQLGISVLVHQLPILKAQKNLIDAQYNEAMTNVDKMQQEIKESAGRVSLMDFQKMVDAANAAKMQAETNKINQVYNIVDKLGFDPSTGLQGLVGTLLMSPDYDEEKTQQLLDNITGHMYNSARMEFLGSHNLAYDDVDDIFDHEFNLQKGLLKEKARSEASVNKENRKGQFWNNIAEKWIRVPSSASFGPFSMSTQ